MKLIRSNKTKVRVGGEWIVLEIKKKKEKLVKNEKMQERKRRRGRSGNENGVRGKTENEKQTGDDGGAAARSWETDGCEWLWQLVWLHVVYKNGCVCWRIVCWFWLWAEPQWIGKQKRGFWREKIDAFYVYVRMCATVCVCVAARESVGRKKSRYQQPTHTQTQVFFWIDKVETVATKIVWLWVHAAVWGDNSADDGSSSRWYCWWTW